MADGVLDVDSLLDPNEHDEWLIDAQADDGQDRTCYWFGKDCPRGFECRQECKTRQGVCPSYGVSTTWCCRSFVSEYHARSYLARHYYYSTYHNVALNTVEAAIVAADEAQVQTYIETAAQRDTYRPPAEQTQQAAEQTEGRALCKAGLTT